MKKNIFIIILSLLFYPASMYAQTEGFKQTTVITSPMQSDTTITTSIIPIEAGTSEQDQKIVNAVYSKFATVSALIGTNLVVKSQNGMVTISGTVISQSQAEAAMEAARAVPGVKDVVSSISVTTNPGVGRGPAANY